MGKLPKSIAKRRRYLTSELRKTTDEGKKQLLEAQMAALRAPYDKEKKKLTKSE